MINVREMTDNDLLFVCQIEKECFASPWKDTDIQYELHENPINRFYVLEVDGVVIGFIDYMVTFNSATISQIAIKENFRHRGYATTLLNKMFESLPNESDDIVEFVTLEVRKSNIAAQKLYLKNGFEIITTKKGYYSNGEDALYMVKRMINGLHTWN